MDRCDTFFRVEGRSRPESPPGTLDLSPGEGDSSPRSWRAARASRREEQAGSTRRMGPLGEPARSLSPGQTLSEQCGQLHSSRGGWAHAKRRAMFNRSGVRDAEASDAEGTITTRSLF